MATKQQQIMHLRALPLEAREQITPGGSIEKLYERAEKRGENLENVYWKACKAAHTAPLGDVLPSAFLTDCSLDAKNPRVVEDLRDTVAWVLEKLRALPAGEELSLNALYSSTMPNGEGPGDITLYRAFEKLIAFGAADGISPYARDEWGEKLHDSHKTMTLVPGPKLADIKAVCTVAIQDFSRPGVFTVDWDMNQQPKFVFLSESVGDAAARDGFMFLNDPAYYDSRLTAGYKGSSLSVGDIVEVRPLEGVAGGQPACFLCAPSGWEVKKGTLKEIQTKEPAKSAPVEPAPVRVADSDISEAALILLAAYYDDPSKNYELGQAEDAVREFGKSGKPEVLAPFKDLLEAYGEDNESFALLAKAAAGPRAKLEPPKAKAKISPKETGPEMS